MSITKGIEIRKKDPTKERPYNERPWTSWERWYENMWIGEWLRKYETKEPPEYYRRLGQFEWEAFIRKEDLLRMADFGDEFKTLAERLAEDEMLVFYDHGN